VRDTVDKSVPCRYMWSSGTVSLVLRESLALLKTYSNWLLQARNYLAASFMAALFILSSLLVRVEPPPVVVV